MIRNLSEKELPTKQEGGGSDGTKAPTSSRLWSGLNDPRIVRVSRSFGGKDRHSKVTTIRGLRDRRVRLSVPTAIQLYDLQDRLGLNQPSKVVDWLLNASQHEIDKLPPLQMPPGNFVQFPQSMAISQEMTPPQAVETTEYLNDNGARSLALMSNKEDGEIFNNNTVDEDLTTLPKSSYWNSGIPARSKQKEIMRELNLGKGDVTKGNELGTQGTGIHNSQVMAHDSILKPSHSSQSGLLNSVMPYTSYYHWEQSNAYISEAPHNYHPIPGSQLVLCPSGTMPSVFASYLTSPADLDMKQLNQFQIASLASQNLTLNTTSLQSGNLTMRPFQANLGPKHHHSDQFHYECEPVPSMRTNSTHSGAPTSTTSHKDSKATHGSNATSFM